MQTGLHSWMILFIVTMCTCGFCQLIRVMYPAPKKVAQAHVVKKEGVVVNQTVLTSKKHYFLELAFMVTEHTVFMFWLYGMTGGAALQHS